MVPEHPIKHSHDRSKIDERDSHSSYSHKLDPSSQHNVFFPKVDNLSALWIFIG